MIGVATSVVGLAVIFSLSGNRQPSTPISPSAEENSPPVASLPISSPQDSDEVDIKGKWNYEQAQKIAGPYLQNNDWTNVEDVCLRESSCNPVHEFLGDYYLPYKNR